jgi:hypothetical protein
MVRQHHWGSDVSSRTGTMAKAKACCAAVDASWSPGDLIHMTILGLQHHVGTPGPQGPGPYRATGLFSSPEKELHREVSLNQGCSRTFACSPWRPVAKWQTWLSRPVQLGDTFCCIYLGWERSEKICPYCLNAWEVKLQKHEKAVVLHLQASKPPPAFIHAPSDVSWRRNPTAQCLIKLADRGF